MNFLYSTANYLFCSCRRRQEVALRDLTQRASETESERNALADSVSSVARPALQGPPQRRAVDLSQWQLAPSGDEEEKKHVVVNSALGPIRIPVLPRDAAFARFKRFDETTQFSCPSEVHAYDPYKKNAYLVELSRVLTSFIPGHDLPEIVSQYADDFDPAVLLLVDTHKYQANTLICKQTIL